MTVGTGDPDGAPARLPRVDPVERRATWPAAASVISPSLVPKVGELLDATVERPAEQLLFVAKRGVPNH